MFKTILLILLLKTSITDPGFGQTDSSAGKNPEPDIVLLGQQHVGAKFPQFQYHSVNGKRYSSETIKGKIIFINFWFKECLPCIAEFSALNTLYEKYRDNKNFLFISFTTDPVQSVKQTRKKYNLKYPVISVNSNEISKLNFGLGYPLNIVLNKSGVITFILCGGASTVKEADELFSREIETAVAKEIQAGKTGAEKHH